MRFKIGQEVVCTTKWWTNLNGKPSTGPKYNDLVTVRRYHTEGKDDFERQCLYLIGWSQAYHEANFEPVVTDKQLAEAIEQTEFA